MTNSIKKKDIREVTLSAHELSSLLSKHFFEENGSWLTSSISFELTRPILGFIGFQKLNQVKITFIPNRSEE